MDLSKLSQILQGEAKFRFKQVYQSLYQDYISDWQQISVLPLSLRERLIKECPLDIQGVIVKDKNDKRAEKALITFSDGISVEAVLIRHRDGRHTLCLSSQAGCALACSFCATGKAGFKRNLSAEEIEQQYLFWARHLVVENKGEKIDNLVFMGMGEPFLNYDNFIKAVYNFHNPEKYNIGSRRMSVSTAGIVEGIKKLASEKLQINLAISLHAPLDSLRSQLMPIAQKYSLFSLFKAVDFYIAKTGRRVMFEYIMLKNVNDGDDDAQVLAQLMHKKLYLLNLIPYNPTGNFQPSSAQRIESFKKILEQSGVAVTTRFSPGQSIGAACGQLAAKKVNKIN
ncbi:MAG: 23S rRNA (adenine(2503)-C(2))-methyltransferase RlmN [Patescibacteria group bacterium]|jgi:23S rRNA (adenine2503-C2)-methyltransferase|nr:23S rRNA (adenine(2503)-C(2))-methyltransferase RlmN [Patescibacteria group bacterium]